jgi:hypothetical protein
LVSKKFLRCIIWVFLKIYFPYLENNNINYYVLATGFYPSRVPALARAKIPPILVPPMQSNIL